MAVYAIGDVQGCYTELRALLDALAFDPVADTLWLAGDLVNRGDGSLETLRYVRELGSSAVCVLGNHDLHLLAVAYGLTGERRSDTIADILAAPDREELLRWLRHRPFAHYDADLDCLMVHAGVLPQWSVAQTLKLAAIAEDRLRRKPRKLLRNAYRPGATAWRDDLPRKAREQVVVGCLTRVRYCTKKGAMHFGHSGAPGTQADGLMPWFDVPGRATAGQRIVFGHWSTLGDVARDDVVALDTGCVWGGKLTAQRLDKPAARVQVDCRGCQSPG
ncbi:MAG: symmetrical bis(5'-nucleosyl)-tetraphosphatase [Pseudomonadota bacterium]